MRIITDTSPACIGYVDTELRFVFCNRTYEDWYGAARETFIGQRVRDIIGEPAYAEVESFYRQVLTGERVSYERTLFRDDSARELLVDLIPDIGEGGTVVGAYISAADITARVRGERALRESEERFQLAVRGSDDGIWDWNIETGHCYFSPRYKELLGYPEQEFEPVRASFEACLHPEDRERTYASMRAHFTAHVPYEVEYRLRSKSGEYRWFHARGQATWDAEGEPVRFTGALRDITQRREAEERFGKTADLLRQTERMAKIGGWELNIADLTPIWSEEIYRIHELDPAARPDLAATIEFYAPEARPVIEQAVQKCIEQGTPWDLELPFVTAKGRRIWVRSVGSAAQQDGKTARLYGTFQDITERKQAEAEIGASRKLLADLIDAIPVPLIVKDESHRFVVVNEAMARFHGVTSSDLVGRLDSEFYPAERAKAYWDEDAAVLLSGVTLVLDQTFTTLSGEQRWVIKQKSRVALPDGRHWLINALLDITERKHAELAVERSRQFLDAVIEGIPQPVFVKDLQHRWVLFNSGYCEMMERSRAELQDRSDPDIYPPELVQRYWAEDDEAFSMDQPLFVETSVTRSDGSVRWLLKSKQRVDLADGAYVVGISTDITHQKQTEMALRESEERFRGLTQLSSDWFWEQDEQFRFVTQTGGGLADMQITPEHMLGKTRWELPFVGMSEGDWALHKAILNAHESFHNLELCRRNDVGALRYISLSGEPVFDAAGRFRGYRGVGRDITAPKRIEEALRESEESHRLLAENSSDMITRLTPDAHIEYASPASAVVIGFSPERLTGRSVGEFIHPDDLAQARWLFSEVVKSNKINVVTCRLRHQDKGWLWVETSFRAVREPGSSRTTQVIGVSRNVDERVRVTEALNRFQYVLDHTRDMIFIADTETLRFSYINLGAAETLGYPREKLLGMAPWEVRTGTTESEYRKAVEPLLRGEVQSLQFEATHRRADGTEFPVDAILQTVRRMGEADLFVWLIRDATERKKIDRMKNEFVSTVSHELRTPLTSIRGSLGLIMGGAAGELPEQAKDLVRIAHNNSERLVRLINDILDIEKIESGKMRFEFRPYRLRPLLEQALEANRGYGAQLGVRFEVEGEIPDSVVRLDSDRFMQVMSNLLSNGAKFSPSPGIVEITARRVEGTVRIGVTDHGPGIPLDFRDKIFGKFCQADSSDSRQKGGTGLGLSIVKAIVEKHGGHVGFDTEIGVGTTFHVTFHEAADTPAQQPPAPFRQPALDAPLTEDAAVATMLLPAPIESHTPRPQPREVAGEIIGEHRDLFSR